MAVTSKNFAELALRTKSSNFFPEKATTIFERAIFRLATGAQFLDKEKKAIFYGKENVNLQDVDARLEDKYCRSFVNKDIDLLHASVGVATEAGELIENFIPFFGKIKINDIGIAVLDYTNILEEFSDLLWYLAIGIEALPDDVVCPQDGETKLEAVMRRNIQKLQARYPEKFNLSDAVNRDIEKEMSEMQKG